MTRMSLRTAMLASASVLALSLAISPLELRLDSVDLGFSPRGRNQRG